MSQAIGTAIIKFVTGAAKVNAIVANVVGTAALMVGSNLLTPKAKFGNVKERDSLNIRGINSRGATDSRSYIYGQVRVGGTVVYMETTGTDNEFLHMVLVHCDHEVEELGDVYVNDVKVVFDSGSEGSLRNAQGTRYRNSLYIADHLGGPSQTVDSTLDAASGKWGSSDKLSGMAYTYIRMELKTGEDNAFPNGIPTFTRVVKGRKVYDPRLDSTQTGIGGSGSHRADDSTTWEWSNNWALCVADYITSDFGYGRFGNSWSNINIAELAASADNCDETVNEVFASWSNGETVSEGWRRSVDVYLLKANNDGTTGSTIPDHTGWSVGDTVNDGTVVWTVEKASLSQTTTRYKLDGIVEADEDPLEVVKEMKGAAAGFIEYIGGSWVITSGRYQAPTITLTESDFAGPITGTSKDDRTRAINGVRGVIANQDDAYNVIDVPPISSAAYVTEDNGVESFRDLKLLYTTSTSAAQRLFKIELLRARQSLAFRSTFTASAFRLKAGDTFSLDFDRYGWSGKVFQVWSTQLKVGGDGELVVDMEFRETASNVYSYTAITDETVVDPAPNTNLPDPFDISNATGLTTTSSSATMIQTGDGTIQPTIHVSWTAAASVNVIGYELRWERFLGQYEYMTLLGREVTSAVIYGVVEDSDYEVQIRSLTPVKTSSWSSVSSVTAVGKSAAPTAPTGFAATAIVEGVKLSMDEHPDIDFKQFLIYQNITNSKPSSHSYTTTDTTKTITGLTAGQQYFFWLEAEDTTAHITAAASNANATPTATAAADVAGLGALATEDTVDLTTTGNGGVSGVLPTSNTDATDNGTTIDTSGNIDAEINLNANGAVAVGKTNAASTTSGFWLGTDGASSYDFHIGNSSNSLRWDGSESTLKIKGDLTAGTININDAFDVDANGDVTLGPSGYRGISISNQTATVAQKFEGRLPTGNSGDIYIRSYGSLVSAEIQLGDDGNRQGFINGAGFAEFKNLTVNDLDLRSQVASLRSHANVSGGGILSFNASGYFKWSSRFIVMANGDGGYFSTNGYFDINCPTSGTITGVGGASNKTATTDGIPLGSWEALYYILPIGSNNATVSANFRVCRYNVDVDIPANWLLLAVRNSDSSNSQLHVINRYQLKQGGYAINTAENIHAGRGNISDGTHTTGSAGYWPGYNYRTYGHEIEAQSDGSTLHIGRQANVCMNLGVDAIDASTHREVVYFRNTNSSISGVAAPVGSISITSAGTGFNTSSDYRLKENVVNIADGIDRLKQLNPTRFNFKVEPDVTVDGFIAHEVEDIVPEAITGTKDAMKDEEYEVSPAVYDDEGELVSEKVMGTRSVPDYQGIDQSKLVPLLTAALQEAIAKIEALEARVAAIES